MAQTPRRLTPSWTWAPCPLPASQPGAPGGAESLALVPAQVPRPRPALVQRAAPSPGAQGSWGPSPCPERSACFSEASLRSQEIRQQSVVTGTQLLQLKLREAGGSAPPRGWTGDDAGQRAPGSCVPTCACVLRPVLGAFVAFTLRACGSAASTAGMGGQAPTAARYRVWEPLPWLSGA